MNNIKFFYQKLCEMPGYSFIVTKNGNITTLPQINKNNIHIIPGSFNPLHESHKEIYFHANKFSNNVMFEMSIERVDKAIVTLPQLQKRLEQFTNYADVIINKAPKFVEKTGIYLSHLNQVIFHVGIDCISRLKDDCGLFGIQGIAAKFFVYDRICNGKYNNLYNEFDENVPNNCLQVSINRSKESLERSSTSIRKEQQ